MQNTPEEKNKLIDAFKAYDWIILNTNPIIGSLELSRAGGDTPSSIREDVNRFKHKATLFDGYSRFRLTDLLENRSNPSLKRDSGENLPDILSSYSINLLLSKLIEKGIPLYKVGDVEICCIADIKRLWEEKGLNDFIPGVEPYRIIRACLTSQRSKIEKELMAGLEPEEQEKDFSASTPENTNYNWVIEGDKVFSNRQLVKLAGLQFELFKRLHSRKGNYVHNKTLEKCWGATPSYGAFLVDTMNELENTLKEELKQKGKIIESKKSGKKNIAYKLPI